MVRTIKYLFHLALLSYRGTVGISGFSPLLLLMGRQLRSSVLKAKEHMARDLTSFPTGQQVWVRPEGIKGAVLSPALRPRSYVVETKQGGVLQRNSRPLVRFAPESSASPPASSEQPEPQQPVALPISQEPDNSTERSYPGQPQGQSGDSDGVVRTRRGQRVGPPDYLNL
ncbi:hypothetical protein HPB49_000298 [Dermacentor silvarum]|uniref:Uncharacterized protein n=1 Tax=Dermacentor silvarum TaxID=543639 RepID=A0ACB8DSK3_DERSI|nr:hypothetical protein HPB49_000298 [Dermacentor silvarum]